MEKFKRKKTEVAYRAHVFDVYNDYLELPDGRNVVYDLIKHHPGACILPVKDDGLIILIKQYRNSIDDITYEIPAGFIDEGEAPEDAATQGRDRVYCGGCGICDKDCSGYWNKR